MLNIVFDFGIDCASLMETEFIAVSPVFAIFASLLIVVSIIIKDCILCECHVYARVASHFQRFSPTTGKCIIDFDRCFILCCIHISRDFWWWAKCITFCDMKYWKNRSGMQFCCARSIAFNCKMEPTNSKLLGVSFHIISNTSIHPFCIFFTVSAPRTWKLTFLVFLFFA